jgi:iron-sulfur cluster insertion protein
MMQNVDLHGVLASGGVAMRTTSRIPPITCSVCNDAWMDNWYSARTVRAPLRSAGLAGAFLIFLSVFLGYFGDLTMLAALTTKDLSLTSPAQSKMSELFTQVEESIQGVRVFATPGGCSGISFGMTFTDSINDNDGVLDCAGFKVIVDDGTLPYLRGVEIDFVDRGDGAATFVFNNLPSMGGGCGSCGSGGGGCG